MPVIIHCVQQWTCVYMYIHFQHILYSRNPSREKTHKFRDFCATSKSFRNGCFFGGTCTRHQFLVCTLHTPMYIHVWWCTCNAHMLYVWVKQQYMKFFLRNVYFFANSWKSIDILQCFYSHTCMQVLTFTCVLDNSLHTVHNEKVWQWAMYMYLKRVSKRA